MYRNLSEREKAEDEQLLSTQDWLDETDRFLPGFDREMAKYLKGGEPT